MPDDLLRHRSDFPIVETCTCLVFCPSCHNKPSLLFAEHVDEEVLGQVPVRQYVVTIPKMLRLCFKYDRKLPDERTAAPTCTTQRLQATTMPQGGVPSTEPTSWPIWRRA